jgi:hypothetical protein
MPETPAIFVKPSMSQTMSMCAAASLFAAPLLLFAQTALRELPSSDTIVERVLERARLEEAEQQAFKQCYAYTRTQVTEFWNGEGELKNRKVRTRTNDPAIAPTARHGQPAGVRKLRAAGPGKQQSPAGPQSHNRGKAFEKSDFPLSADLLGRFDFTLAGREMIQERPTLIVDFQPANRKLPERGIKDRFINQTAGRVWLDETDYAVAKADLRLTGKVHVVGGLVGAVSKFNLTIERERTAEGLWFIREQAWHLEGREGFVRRKVDYREECKEVRKVQEPGAVATVQTR